MKYLKKFADHSEYLVFTNTDKFIRPNTSVCAQENEVHYNPILPDYSKEYLTFVAKADGTFRFIDLSMTNTLSYSLDGGNTWTALANDTDSPTVTSGNKILWKGTCTSDIEGIGYFSSTAQFDVEGNAMSLLFGDDFKGQESLEGNGSALSGLFSGNTNVVSVENLSLPATTLAESCYAYMFYGCTSLTSAPQLPAITLADNCYAEMFGGCTSLTTAPELPATSLVYACYVGMFDGCTSLTTAPQLPATTLANDCYRSMFVVCTGLITAPELPATTLFTSCYKSMFYKCTSLTTAPELPATTLAAECYSGMFSGCTSLTTAPQLPATTLVDRCYFNMFMGCTSLNSVTCLATNISASYCTYNWLSGVASSGTFTKTASMTSWTTGVSGIPNGWTVQNAS